jgi:hypothetical protein
MSFLRQRYDDAVGRVDEFLRERYAGERLNGARDPSLVGYSDVWKIDAAEGGLPQMFLAVDRGYPATLPKVVLANGSEFWGVVPHVNHDGTVCTDPPHVTRDQYHVGDVADAIIRKAAATVREGLGGGNKRDFTAEIESYWSQTVTSLTPPIWSLVPPATETTREIAWVLGPSAIILAPTKEECAHWLKMYRVPKAYSRPIRTTLCVKLNTPLYPLDFFETNGEAVDFIGAEDETVQARLWQLLDEQVEPLPVLLHLDTPNGVAQIAIRLVPAGKKQRLTRGYRAGKAPTRLAARPHYSKPCSRHRVERGYADWIHSRGGAHREPGAPSLLTKKVLIIGCGAIGADVAQILANAGVGMLRLVDQDLLTFDNIGRHLLGAADVGKLKCVALAEHLQRQFPHLDCKAILGKWEAISERDAKLLRSFDLIISATGEWSSDSNLNIFAKSAAKPPVLFGWTEPHGLAGHALLVGTRGGCFACGRDNVGEVTFRVTDWPEDALRRVPACGGFYQPYGAAEIGPIKNMIASLAISSLLGNASHSQLRTWIGDLAEIKRLGAAITEGWKDMVDQPLIGQMHSREWEPNPGCPQCNA